MTIKPVLVAVFCCVLTIKVEAQHASLKSSPESIGHMFLVALAGKLTFFPTVREVRESIANGLLVQLSGNDDYLVDEWVSFPYVLRETKLFLEHFALEYHLACRTQLVLTSGTRPVTPKLPNASPISVHPVGMAIDIRTPRNLGCRNWLDDTLIFSRAVGDIEANWEIAPPHYHIAILPQYSESWPMTE